MSILKENLKNPHINKYFNDDGTIAYGYNNGGRENHVFFITEVAEILAITTVQRHIHTVTFNDENDTAYITASGVYEEGDDIDCDWGEGDQIEPYYDTADEPS